MMCCSIFVPCTGSKSSPKITAASRWNDGAAARGTQVTSLTPLYSPPVGDLVLGGVVGDVRQIGQAGIEDKHFPVPEPVGGEGHPGLVGGPGGAIIVGRVIGQVGGALPIESHGINFLVAIPVRSEDDHTAIGRCPSHL